MRCLCLTLIICIFAAPSMAQEFAVWPKLTCKETNQSFNFINIVIRTFDTVVPAALPTATRQDQEKLTCYHINRIHTKARNNNTDNLYDLFHDTVDNTIKYHNSQNDDLLALVLKEILAANPWDWNSGTPYRHQLAMIYSNPNGSEYRPEIAQHLFMRSIFSDLEPTDEADTCNQKINHDKHKAQNGSIKFHTHEWARLICTERDAKFIFALARAYENCRYNAISDPALALFFYQRSYNLGNKQAHEDIKRMTQHREKGLLSSRACFTRLQSIKR